jgi:hypothetical protein
MRTIILAVLVAVGIGLGFTPAVNAAPASGFGIGHDAAQTSNVTKVQHWRWGSRRHWRWGSRRHWRRCHYRTRSRFYRC